VVRRKPLDAPSESRRSIASWSRPVRGLAVHEAIGRNSAELSRVCWGPRTKGHRVSDWNAKFIEEFRANAGKVGGFFANKPVLILHTTGARSGLGRLAPLVYRKEGDRVFVFASKGGSHSHPDWYHNLKANPAVTVEIGADTVSATAAEIVGVERDAVYTIGPFRSSSSFSSSPGSAPTSLVIQIERPTVTTCQARCGPWYSTGRGHQRRSRFPKCPSLPRARQPTSAYGMGQR
jgi:deazaflavin-dependent oxidoreductase (nitroreductase family)